MIEFKLCEYSKRLLNKIAKLEGNNEGKLRLIKFPPVDFEVVKKAIAYARHYHGEQKRKSGEPYYSHPIAVAFLVADYVCDTESMVISLLHDTLEDTTLTVKEIEQEFGTKVAEGVLDLTRIKSGTKISAGDTIDTLWQQKKPNILLIKLFDRLHNVLTLSAQKPEKQIKVLKETLNRFLPAVMYLEIRDLETRIINSCFDILKNIKPNSESGSEPEGLDEQENEEFLSSEDNFRMPSLDFQNGSLPKRKQ